MWRLLGVFYDRGSGERCVRRSGGKLPSALSTEQLVDCELEDDGCGGGDIPEAVRYLQRVGVATASDYPDESSASGRTKMCTWNKKSVVRVQSMRYGIPHCVEGDCQAQSEEKLAAAVAQFGPLSICINSGDHQAGDWEKYTGGVLEKSCLAKANLIDHCVQLVGYNKTAPTPFWKIRNSWGTEWGEDGFIRIAYGNKNMCVVVFSLCARAPRSVHRRAVAHLDRIGDAIARIVRIACSCSAIARCALPIAAPWPTSIASAMLSLASLTSLSRFCPGAASVARPLRSMRR